MDIGSKILSDMVIWSKYAMYLPDQNRRETWTEIVDRNKKMHIDRYPQIEDIINEAYELVYAKKVLPSMRSLQFGGAAIKKNNIRTYNCSYLPIESVEAFDEILYLLLCGTGVGYSVRRKDIDKLPPIVGVKKLDSSEELAYDTNTFTIGDSIEGWGEAIRLLFKAYTEGLNDFRFDFSSIRPKGARLSSGGLAPGPEPLEYAISKVREILDSIEPGSKLTSVQVHDIICHLSDCVLAGGIRRSAMIVLFDPDDKDMLACKYWENLKDNQQRFRANNSTALRRDSTTKEEFMSIWKMVEDSNAGEPGIFWTNADDFGTNPCAEIALNPYQFCNLCEINASDIEDQYDYLDRVWAATVIGTLQASYTNFPYLRDIWKETTEREALLGIGMTGIASGAVLELDMEAAANYAKKVNAVMANLIGINPAARITTVKPSGTSSIVLGCSSGVHAWHDNYYIRRIRLLNNEPLAVYIMENHPELFEVSKEKPGTEIVVSVPIKAPYGAITRHEKPLDLLERVKLVADTWIKGGHNYGPNYHNVSCTVSIKPEEWRAVGEWMWDNKDHYTGLSCLPFWDGVYEQTPFESITEEQYNERLLSLKGIDITKVLEYNDTTNFEGEAACAGGACSINRI